ncbi:MAG: NAD-dependent epimerase/dehydratase family protein [Bdellovibrionales bacterium]|nr:NAD-dependent epimerase/dehydratase family protein [Bdellovibrionales bacterium]
MRALITGGLGFIGNALVKRLLAQGHECHIVDNCINNCWQPDDAARSGAVVHAPVPVSEYDLASGPDFDVVYHLASPVGPVGVLQWAGEMASMIVSDTHALARYCIEKRAKLINISTSEIYGQNVDNQAQREDIDKIVPAEVTIRLEYAVAKLTSEILLTNLAKVHPLKHVTIRPFNVAGPSQRGEVGFVTPRFIELALSNEPITVFGDGLQERCFTHVEDIVDSILALAESKISNEVFNVGNPQNIVSILDLAKMVKEMTSSQSSIIFVDPKELFGPHYAEAYNKIPSIEKVTSLTSWRPSRSLHQILVDVIESVRG